MATFKDARGTTWDLAITVEAIKRVKSSLDVDLGNIHLGNPPLSTRLDTDVILLIDVIFALVRPQAEKRGLSDVEFGESLGGDAAFAAREAFWRSLIDFFQKFHRDDAVAVIQKQLDLVSAVIQMAAEEAGRIPIGETVERIRDSFGAPSTSGRESSESAPIP